MKKAIVLLIMCLPFLSMAQTSNKNKTEGGIKWATGLSWEQVKQKAKAENKYIFLDCFTTWCGPCKMLDKTVFINDTVGDFFNQHFISARVQMDKTDDDDEYVKSWYKDASVIEKEYLVDKYPTAIFFAPSGIIVHKDGGFRPVQDFIAMAKVALTPGKVYVDPYAEYKKLVSEYRQGIKHYDRMAEMVRTAQQLNDGDFARELLKDQVEYASKLNKNDRYTKENIEVWSCFVLKPDSKALGFFLKDGNKIDNAMNRNGYSRDIVDNTIQARIVDSFFRMQKGETKTITGVMVPNSEVMFKLLAESSDGKIEPDYVEADWKELENRIKKYFNKDYTVRNVLTARIRWYQKHQNKVAAVKMYFAILKKWPPAKLKLGTNDFVWDTFLYANDKELLKEASKWQGKLIEQNPDRHEIIDTYASLLYKLGKTAEAIQWEEKALSLLRPGETDSFGADQKTIYREVIEKMKKGEPTYLEQGAIWVKK